MSQPPKEIDLTVSGGEGFSRSEVKFDVEKERLRLAKWVLLGLAVLFFASLLAYVTKVSFLNSDSTKEAFGFVRESFPPIVTLILGAYFRSKE
ncbi:hypothetical protein [Caballeronia sp. M23-90]